MLRGMTESVSRERPQRQIADLSGKRRELRCWDRGCGPTTRMWRNSHLLVFLVADNENVKGFLRTGGFLVPNLRYFWFLPVIPFFLPVWPDDRLRRRARMRLGGLPRHGPDLGEDYGVAPDYHAAMSVSSAKVPANLLLLHRGKRICASVRCAWSKPALSPLPALPSILGQPSRTATFYLFFPLAFWLWATCA